MRQTISRILRFSLVLGLVLLAVAVGGGWLSHASAAGPIPAAAPAIQITPNHGKYGTVVVVTGTGFAPHEQVAIYKQTRPFFAYETDGNGNFLGVPHPLLGPGPVSGIITITGTGRTSALKATTTFTVTP